MLGGEGKAPRLNDVQGIAASPGCCRAAPKFLLWGGRNGRLWRMGESGAVGWRGWLGGGRLCCKRAAQKSPPRQNKTNICIISAESMKSPLLHKGKLRHDWTTVQLWHHQHRVPRAVPSKPGLPRKPNTHGDPQGAQLGCAAPRLSSLLPIAPLQIVPR